jgi:hypothetical protein
LDKKQITQEEILKYAFINLGWDKSSVTAEEIRHYLAKAYLSTGNTKPTFKIISSLTRGPAEDVNNKLIVTFKIMNYRQFEKIPSRFKAHIYTTVVKREDIKEIPVIEKKLRFSIFKTKQRNVFKIIIIDTGKYDISHSVLASIGVPAYIIPELNQSRKEEIMKLLAQRAITVFGKNLALLQVIPETPKISFEQ